MKICHKEKRQNEEVYKGYFICCGLFLSVLRERPLSRYSSIYKSQMYIKVFKILVSLNEGTNGNIRNEAQLAHNCGSSSLVKIYVFILLKILNKSL